MKNTYMVITDRKATISLLYRQRMLIELKICDWLWENHHLCTKINVTEPAKIGHICTQNLALFLNFNLQYLLKYKCYYNEIFMPYSQFHKKVKKVYRT